MSDITDFLPQYRELNSLLTHVVNNGVISYNSQTVFTDFYKQFSDSKKFEKMVLGFTLEKDKPTCTLLLSSIKTEVETNIRLYEAAKDMLDKIDTKKVCTEVVSDYENAIKERYEIVTECSRELKSINNSLEATAYSQCSQEYINKIRREYDYLTKLHKEENEKQIILHNERRIEEKEKVIPYYINRFGEIYSLSLSFLGILNYYLSLEVPVAELPTDIIKEIITAESTNNAEVDSNMIFHTMKFDQLLILEQKLITDKYLSEDLHWVSTHDNGKTDIRKLVTFLTALIDNNYFLPNRDPKIKTFFELRYHISIGQNFEKARRARINTQYKATFFSYPF